MKNAQNILFDLDGTISDPKEGITKSIAYALTELGHKPPPLEALTRFIGPPLREAFRELLGNPEQVEEALALYRYRYAEQGRGMIENILYPAIPETLARLKDMEKRLFIATSKPHLIATKVVHHFGLEGCFVKIYGPELDGTHSDKSALIAHLLDQEKILPHEAVMIGDRKYDMEGAIRNGVSAIGALWGYGTQEELRNAGAEILVSSPAALPDLLSG